VPVKQLAISRHLPIRQPATLTDVSLDADRLDLLVVAAYGLILPRHVLTAPRLGCLNVHASLLPRWRGAAPVERAIIAGDRETGVCLMAMDEGLDTGPVYRCTRLAIGPDETGATLEARLAAAGSRLLVDTLPQLEELTPTPQPESGATYASKITARDSQIDWRCPAEHIERQIRALSHRRPVTLTCEAGAVRIRVLQARLLDADDSMPGAQPGTIFETDREGIALACAQGALLITRLQLNRGKGKPMNAIDAVNGYPDLLCPGNRFDTAGE
jgi:methionyl-tRNA formyltransferase